MSLIRKIWEFLFGNFMWLYIIMGVCSWIGIYPMTFQLLMSVSFIYSVTLISKVRQSSLLDFCVISYVLYIFLNAITIDYPNRFEMWRAELFYSLFPISFYFISKASDEGIEPYLKKMIVPMTIVMIIGIVLYFNSPQWYTALKYEQLFDHYGYKEGAVPERMLREAFRLSSIWSTPYVIGYANGFFILFLLTQLVLGNLAGKEKRKYIFLFVLSFVILILAGFKSLLVAFFVSLFLIISKTRSGSAKVRLLGGVSLILIITAFVSISIDAEFFDFFVQRMKDTMTEEGITTRLEHTSGGIQLNTIFGAGFGHYGMGAKSVNGWVIQDSQYQRVLAELGIVGFTLFLFMLLVATISSFKRKSILEMCILVTYIVSFIGSSSISGETTFPFIFWYALGCISRKSSTKQMDASIRAYYSNIS